jgi:antitoxin VapB
VATARLFQSGGSQAVRLPKAFRFEGKEVEIFRRGEEVVLRKKAGGMARAFELIASLPDDYLEELDDPPPQERKGL